MVLGWLSWKVSIGRLLAQAPCIISLFLEILLNPFQLYLTVKINDSTGHRAAYVRSCRARWQLPLMKPSNHQWYHLYVDYNRRHATISTISRALLLPSSKLLKMISDQTKVEDFRLTTFSFFNENIRSVVHYRLKKKKKRERRILSRLVQNIHLPPSIFNTLFDYNNNENPFIDKEIHWRSLYNGQSLVRQ